MNELDASYQALIEDIYDEVSLLANTSAYLNEILTDINWVGFYLYKNGNLILGPFQGKVACISIPLNKGVCGYCATSRKPIIVDDVHQFEGHITCDSASQSEMVLPILINNELYGVLDIDAPIKNRFTLEDQAICEKIIEQMVNQLLAN